MAEIDKPSIDVAWAETGDRTVPAGSEITTGFPFGFKPKRDTFNWLAYRSDKMHQHVNQHGICAWDATTGYIGGKSYVQGSDGVVYIAKNDNAGVNPVTDTSEAHWTVAFYRKSTMDDLMVGMVADFPVPVAPAGWWVADNSLKTIAAAPKLYNRIGHMHAPAPTGLWAAWPLRDEAMSTPELGSFTLQHNIMDVVGGSRYILGNASSGHFTTQAALVTGTSGSIKFEFGTGYDKMVKWDVSHLRKTADVNYEISGYWKPVSGGNHATYSTIVMLSNNWAGMDNCPKIQLLWNKSNSTVLLQTRSRTGVSTSTASSTISGLSTGTHFIKVAREGSLWKVYVDGTAVITTASNTAFSLYDMLSFDGLGDVRAGGPIDSQSNKVILSFGCSSQDLSYSSNCHYQEWAIGSTVSRGGSGALILRQTAPVGQFWLPNGKGIRSGVGAEAYQLVGQAMNGGVESSVVLSQGAGIYTNNLYGHASYYGNFGGGSNDAGNMVVISSPTTPLGGRQENTVRTTAFLTCIKYS